MDNQSYVMPIAAVTLADHAYVFDHGVSAALGYQVHGLGQICQTLDGSHCHTVVHWNDYGLAGFPIHDPFFTDLLTYAHASILPFSKYFKMAALLSLYNNFSLSRPILGAYITLLASYRRQKTLLK
jgi:hypothetical protein